MSLVTARKAKKDIFGSLGLGTESGDTGITEEMLSEDETASAATGESVEATAEVNESDAAADSLDDSAEVQEEVALAAEAASARTGKDQGFSPVEAALANMALRNATKRFGLNMNDMMPRTESYGSTGGRIESHSLARESMKETAKAFWEAMKAQFLKIWNQIREAVRKTFDSAAALAKRAEAVRARAENVNGQKENNTIEVNSVATIGINGKIEPAALGTGLTAIKEAVFAWIKVETKAAAEAGVTKILDMLTAVAEGKDVTVDDKDTSQADMLAVVDRLPGSVTADSTVASRFPSGSKISKVLPGNRVIVISGKDEDTGRGGTPSIASSTTKAADSNSVSAPVLEPNAITGYCDTITDTMEQIVTYNKSWQRREAAIEKFNKGVDQLVSRVERSDTGSGEDVSSDNSAKFKKVVKIGKEALRKEGVFAVNLISYAGKTGAGVLSYCEASLNQYKAK